MGGAEAPVDLQCRECGDPVTLSASRAREHRRTGGGPLCLVCKQPPIRLTPKERAAYLSWWQERYPPEELAAMGAALNAWRS